jgi:hypothetical protein
MSNFEFNVPKINVLQKEITDLFYKHECTIKEVYLILKGMNEREMITKESGENFLTDYKIDRFESLPNEKDVFVKCSDCRKPFWQKIIQVNQ